eukprot:3884772-Pyramimonas_sp.AAC.1
MSLPLGRGPHLRIPTGNRDQNSNACNGHAPAQSAILGAPARENAQTCSECYSGCACSGERQNRFRLLFWACPLGREPNQAKIAILG